MKFSNKKKIIIGSIIGVLIGTLLSVSYAMFTYSKTNGTNSQLVAGDIYMRYKETSTNINIPNMMPTSGNPLPSSYFEFTVGGKNTTTDKDIWYDVNIKWGDSNGNKVRIQDQFLKFTLIEKKDNGSWTTPVNAKSYSDFQNGTRIWVDKILKNQTTDTTHTYRLYVWIDESVVISNTKTAGVDYTISEWNNLFASVKVDVTGDFTQKTLPVTETPAVPGTIASCPNCKFMFTENLYYFGDEIDYEQETVSTDYRDVITGETKTFLGFIESNGVIDREFVCGIKGENPNEGTPFCIEGSVVADSTYTSNNDVLYPIYGSYDNQTELGCKNEDSEIQCNGLIQTENSPSGTVSIYRIYNDNVLDSCVVADYEGGFMKCSRD